MGGEVKGPKKKGLRRSDKNHTRGQYRCPECGWAAKTLNAVMKHKQAERHS